MHPFKLRVSEVAWIVGAPLLLAIVELYHPHPHDLLNVDVDTWLAVHYAQIPLFALTALAIAWLVRGRRDVLASVCRAAMFVFGVTYVVFDTAAGVVTGILVQAAHETTAPDTWRDAIDAVWTHPIVGGLVSRCGCRRAVAQAFRQLVGACVAVGGVQLWHRHLSHPCMARGTADFRRNGDSGGVAAVGASSRASRIAGLTPRSVPLLLLRRTGRLRPACIIRSQSRRPRR